MRDPYPANFEIEIDRVRLTSYLRSQHRKVWFLVMLVFGVLVGSLSGAKYYENHATLPLTTVLWAVGWRFAAILIACQLLGVIGYLLSARTISAYVNDLMLSVEGPFIRVRKNVGGVQQDRRVHFRLILIYSTKQDAQMKKLGISTLVMTTAAGAEAVGAITVPGVKDCLKVRDLLSEIDSHRENSSPSAGGA